MLSVENEAIFAICMKTGWKLKSFFFDGSNWCDSRVAVCAAAWEHFIMAGNFG